MKRPAEPYHPERVEISEEDELKRCCQLIEQNLYNALVCLAVFSSTVQEQEQYIKDMVKTLQRVSDTCTFGLLELFSANFWC